MPIPYASIGVGIWYYLIYWSLFDWNCQTGEYAFTILLIILKSYSSSSWYLKFEWKIHLLTCYACIMRHSSFDLLRFEVIYPILLRLKTSKYSQTFWNRFSVRITTNSLPMAFFQSKKNECGKCNRKHRWWSWLNSTRSVIFGQPHFTID